MYTYFVVQYVVNERLKTFFYTFQVEDMSLPDHKDLPELKRIPELLLSGEAFANTLMVYEFLHNFGERLGLGKSLIYHWF